MAAEAAEAGGRRRGVLEDDDMISRVKPGALVRTLDARARGAPAWTSARFDLEMEGATPIFPRSGTIFARRAGRRERDADDLHSIDGALRRPRDRESMLAVIAAVLSAAPGRRAGGLEPAARLSACSQPAQFRSMHMSEHYHDPARPSSPQGHEKTSRRGRFRGLARPDNNRSSAMEERPEEIPN